ncbi:teichuronic acid biosynthesis glycosyltransferase TuaG [Lachnospiraceae bacterium XBB2008]|nr:teichuronic acid biosynthesis glycosyltransferase TuaG [Lachnospiraceae bacterium XBB2008]
MVSIIVPVYRAKEYIANTIGCVRAQTYTDWELILVDDHSGDGTAEEIKRLIGELDDERIRLIECEENHGAAHARNTGLDSARGRYIAFLDADDVWYPDRLKIGMEYMSEHPGAGFVFSAYEFGDENAKGTGRIVHVPESLDYKQALSRTVIFTTTTLFDTEIIPISLIHMPQVGSEDTATWWQILRAGHTAYGIDRVTAIYRRPASSLSSDKSVAIRRIWNLYRNVEHLPVIRSAVCFIGWAFRATLRRI